jgi:hypothetical protein
MINIPRTSSEGTKPHSTVGRASVVSIQMKPLDVNLSQQNSQWIIVLGFRVSAELLLILKISSDLRTHFRKINQRVHFQFLYVAFFETT